MTELWHIDEFAPAALDEFAEALTARLPAADAVVPAPVVCAGCRGDLDDELFCATCGRLERRAA